MRTRETATQTLTATTTRPIRFSYCGDTDRRTLVTETRVYPTGTTVHVGEMHDDGYLVARVAGTLFVQSITLADVDPA